MNVLISKYAIECDIDSKIMIEVIEYLNSFLVMLLLLLHADLNFINY